MSRLFDLASAVAVAGSREGVALAEVWDLLQSAWALLVRALSMYGRAAPLVTGAIVAISTVMMVWVFAVHLAHPTHARGLAAASRVDLEGLKREEVKDDPGSAGARSGSGEQLLEFFRDVVSREPRPLCYAGPPDLDAPMECQKVLISRSWLLEAGSKERFVKGDGIVPRPVQLKDAEEEVQLGERVPGGGGRGGAPSGTFPSRYEMGELRSGETSRAIAQEGKDDEATKRVPKVPSLPHQAVAAFFGEREFTHSGADRLEDRVLQPTPYGEPCSGGSDGNEPVDAFHLDGHGEEDRGTGFRTPRREFDVDADQVERLHAVLREALEVRQKLEAVHPQAPPTGATREVDPKKPEGELCLR